MPLVPTLEAELGRALVANHLVGLFTLSSLMFATARIGAPPDQRVRVKLFLTLELTEFVSKVSSITGDQNLANFVFRDRLLALVVEAYELINCCPLDMLFELINCALAAEAMTALKFYCC